MKASSPAWRKGGTPTPCDVAKRAEWWIPIRPSLKHNKEASPTRFKRIIQHPQRANWSRSSRAREREGETLHFAAGEFSFVSCGCSILFHRGKQHSGSRQKGVDVNWIPPLAEGQVTQHRAEHLLTTAAFQSRCVMCFTHHHLRHTFLNPNVNYLEDVYLKNK